MTLPSRIADTPAPPYYAVIFTSERTDAEEGYGEMGARMMELAREQPGFLGVESARADGLGITISYWADEASIAAWSRHVEHRAAQALGRSRWYERYAARIAKVERSYGFEADSGAVGG